MTEGDELAYALVTPYSLHKSRTGGILARLLWTNVKLVAARMYAPRPESDFVEKYCDAIYDPEEKSIPLTYQKLLIEYAIQNFIRPNARGFSNRLTLLLFRGPNAREDIAEAVGHISEHVRGDNVRGTYGDFFRDDPEVLKADSQHETRRRLSQKYGRLQEVGGERPRSEFFEPAVLTGVTPEMNEAHLKLFRDYAYTDGGYVLDALQEAEKDHFETSMVVLKPESFRHRNPLPGNIMDFFARSGMFITAMKVLELGVEEAQQFYSLKLPQFREQLKGMVAQRARTIVERCRMMAEQAIACMGAQPAPARDPQNVLLVVREAERLFCEAPGPAQVKIPVVERIYEELARRLQDLNPPESLYEELAEDLKDINARCEFDELIRYMTGKDPKSGQSLNPEEPTYCMALLYSGPNVMTTLRKRLKELREVYGRNVLQNRAHASDPEEDPTKEMRVLGMPTEEMDETRPCDVERLVNEFYWTE